MTPVLFVLVAAGASMLRWLTIDALRSMRGGSGTIAVNVAGSFALGLVVGSEVESLVIVGVAGLGSFTTFSTMALDFTTVPRHEAVGYLVTTLVLGLLAAWLGLQVGG
jgi:CrcB protein